MKNWTGMKHEEYPDCDHCFTYWQKENPCYEALTKMVLERYPNKNKGPHSGFYYQQEPDGVPIMPCGGVVRCTFRMWGGTNGKYCF